MAAPTIRQYCEEHRKHDDLPSLYDVLYAQFGRREDEPITEEIQQLLESID